MKNRILSAAIAMLALGLPSLTDAQTPMIGSWYFGHNGYISNVSKSATYAVGVAPAGDQWGKTEIVDLSTGELKNLPVTAVVNQKGKSSAPQDGDVVRTDAVSDDGLTIAGTYNGLPAIYRDGVWTELEFPNAKRDDKYRGYSATIKRVAANGKYIVAMAYTDDFNMLPALWVDGKLVELPNLPETDYTGEPCVNGTYFQDITEDGRYVLVGVNTHHPGWGCSYLLYDRETDNYEIFGLNEILDRIEDGVWCDKSEVDGASYVGFSRNGKWIAGSFMAAIDNGTMYPTDANVPFLYNMETKEMQVFENADDIGKCICGVTDDGRVVAMSTAASPNHSVVFYSNGFWYTLENILDQTYGVNFASAANSDTLSGTVWGISPDGRTIAGMPPMYRTQGYVVSLPDQSFFDATAGVNMLNDYSIFPDNNYSIARIDYARIRFDREVNVADGAVVTITDPAGNVVAASQSIGRPSGSNDRRYGEITFPSTHLEQGVVYTLTIPAGTFVMSSTGMTNNEIKLTYFGREEVPSHASDITPADGSYVSSLGSTNMIALTYNTTVQPVEGMTGFLYVEDNEKPLCSLLLGANDNMGFAYPAVERMLREDVRYRVEIPAGAFVDITGYCPSEAVNLDYVGSYVDNGDHAGFDTDFNDVAESLRTFMNYEGDHGTPLKWLEDLGFDADNTPWNFSVRESATSVDYCAAAHSMFEKGGRADDWMVLPQIEIVNDAFFFNFKAKNYDATKHDRLKVVIWEYNDVISSVNSEIINLMRTEGEVVFDEELNTGGFDKSIEDGWTTYNIPGMEKYAGKKIYVAFVNENENQSMVFVDDIHINCEGTFTVGLNVESQNVVLKEDAKIGAYVRVDGDIHYDAIKAELKTADGTVVSTYEANGLSLEKGSRHSFVFADKLPLTVGSRNDFSIDVTMGESTIGYKGYINSLTFEPVKRVVLEEGTGSWCTNCPRGIMAIEYIEGLLPDNFIPISIHNGDQYAYQSYLDFLGINAFPSGRVNRRVTASDSYIDEMGFYNWATPEGAYDNLPEDVERQNPTFYDAVVNELGEYALAQINIKAARLEQGNKLEVDNEIKFAINDDKARYNILNVLVENNLKGVQQSNVSGSADPSFTEFWTSAGGYVQVNYADVARAVSGVSFHGQSNLIPLQVNAGETYTATTSIKFPAKSDVLNCGVVTLLINSTTGEIVNAARTFDIDTTGVEEIGADSVEARFTLNGGTILLNGSSENVEVYTLQGVRVANSGLERGLYIVRGIAGSTPVVGKIIVK